MIIQVSDKTLGTLAAAVLGTAALVASFPAASADLSPLQARAAQGLLTQADQAAPDEAATNRHAKEEHIEARIKRLHDQLQITAAQQQQWEAVTAVMRSNAKEIDDLAQKRAQNASMMNAVDDLRSYQRIAEAHAEGLNKLVAAFDALYGTMSNEQKQNADVVFSHVHRHAAASKE